MQTANPIHPYTLGSATLVATPNLSRTNPTVEWAGRMLADALRFNLPADDDESLPLRIDLDRLLERAERIQKRHRPE